MSAADYVRHSCGEHVYVDEWEEHLAECADQSIQDEHALTDFAGFG